MSGEGTTRVYREQPGAWVAVRDHGSWADETPFATWDAAMDHALWIASRP